jgi:hypothetical protein
MGAVDSSNRGASNGCIERLSIAQHVFATTTFCANRRRIPARISSNTCRNET